MLKIGNIKLPDFPLLLAPMEDVSDPPFRAVCKANGADMMYTEFISSEGLIRDVLLGVVGAFIGGYLFSLFGASGVTGLNLYSLLVAVVGAVVFLVVYHTVFRRRSFV